MNAQPIRLMYYLLLSLFVLLLLVVVVCCCCLCFFFPLWAYVVIQVLCFVRVLGVMSMYYAHVRCELGVANA